MNALISGRKRRRIGGAGIKLKYVELDSLLLVWYRERRTKVDPNAITSSADIRREKVTFKQLQRHGEQISIQLKHQPPSSKWFHRFLKRHRFIHIYVVQVNGVLSVVQWEHLRRTMCAIWTRVLLHYLVINLNAVLMMLVHQMILKVILVINDLQH